MSTDIMTERLARIYAALDAVLETDLTKVSATVVRTETTIEVFQDFRGGLSDAEIENRTHMLIHNLANLKDHTLKWFRASGLNRKHIDDFRAANLAILIIEDLSNNDKHGYPPRDAGLSGKAPQLININRIMRLSVGGEVGSSTGVYMMPSGQLRSFGKGSTAVVITGDIVDSAGARLGDLYETQSDALLAWEGMFRSLGLRL